MFVVSKLKIYFEYEDNVRTIVSIITGVLIAIYTLLSGIMIIQLITSAILGIKEYNIITFLILIIPGGFLAAGILKAEIFLLNLIAGNTELEKYSYLRLVLFISIIVYLIISVFYSLYMISDSLLKKLLPVQLFT